MATHTIQAPGEVLMAAPITAVENSKTTMRLLYIDNIRTFLTVLVLLHHVMIIYAGSGSWIYNENRQDLLTEVIGNVLCTINQAFFMGLFLLISAYFVPGAYDRKGAVQFWKDRLVRLGIPLVIYSWLIHPVFIYWYLITTQGLKMPWWEFYTRQYFSFGPWIGPGPLWFIETLLIFTLVYAMYRWFARTPPAKQLTQVSFPSNRALVLFALLMGVAGFVFRLMFPVDWNYTPLNLQLPFFAQYIAMFIAGLLAYRHGWLENIPESTSRRWLKVTAMVILLYLPGALLGGALENVEPFKGGWHWQSLFYAVWEAYLCVGLCIGLLYLFRKHANLQGRFSASMSRSAYAAYIVQAPVITVVALMVRDLTLHPLLKFGLVGLIAVALCFIIGGFLRRLPYANNVL